jgi:hypothetical protein
MSPVFKTLTNVAVWMLFVTGCWVILTSLPFRIEDITAIG